MLYSSQGKASRVQGTRLTQLCRALEFKEIKQTLKVNNSIRRMVKMKIDLCTLTSAIAEAIIKEVKSIGPTTKIQLWIETVVKVLNKWVPAVKLPSNCTQPNPIRIITPRIIMQAINTVDR